jgi:O-antigen/teichoic acid export membrane protein
MLNYLKAGIKDSLIYGLGSISVKVAGLLLLPLYTSHFSIGEYGLLGFLEVTSTAIISIFGLSFYQAFFVWYWDGQYTSKQKSLFFTALISLVIIAGLLILSGCLFSLKISDFILGNESGINISSKNRSLLFKYLLISSALQIVATIPSKLLQLQQKSKLYTISNFLMLAVNVSLIIILLNHTSLKLPAIYIAQTISSSFYLVFLLKFIIKNIKPHFDFSILYKMLNYVAPLIISTIAGLIISISDRYILRHFSGFDNLGVYSFASKISNAVMVILIGPIQMAINPLLVRVYNIDKNTRFYSKAPTYISFFIMPFIIFVSLFCFEAVKILAHKTEYWHAIYIIPILAIATIFSILKDLGGLHLQLIKRIKVLSLVIIMVSSINIFLNFIFISMLSYIGASISFFLSQLIYFILMHYFANKYIPTNYEYRKIISVIFISIILITCGFLLNFAPLYIRLIGKSLLIILYPIILFKIKFFEQIEIKSLFEILKVIKNPKNWNFHLFRFSK